MDHLAAIRTFLRVAATENFSEAARQLGIPKSLVTNRISYLERALAAPLLTRTTRKVRLTDAGRLYSQRALALVDELAALESSIAESDVQLRGLLRISCPTSFGVRFLGPALSAFLSEQPNLTAELVLNDQRVNPAEAGFDVVLTDSAGISGEFEEAQLCILDMALCAAPSYLQRTCVPRVPADLREHDCVHYLYNDTGHDWRFERDGESFRVTIHPRLSTNNGGVMLDAIRNGNGMTILPHFLVEADLASGRLVEVLPDYSVPSARLKAVFPRRREVVPKTRLLIEFLQRRCSAIPHRRPDQV